MIIQIPSCRRPNVSAAGRNLDDTLLILDEVVHKSNCIMYAIYTKYVIEHH